MNRWWTFFIVALATTAAAAYAIDARTIFRRFGERQALERTTPGALIGRAQLAGPAGSAAREIPVRLDLGPGQCRLKLELPEGDATTALAAGKVTTEGPAVPALEAMTALACPLFVLRNVPASDAEAATARFAAHLGVDTAIVVLSRLDRHAAYVVGAHPRELDHPQLWFDKDSARPVRVVGKYGGQVYDLRFEDPASLATNRRAPRAAELWSGNERLLSIRLMTADAEGVQSGPASVDEGDEDQE